MKKKILTVSVFTMAFTAVYGQRWEPMGQKGSEIRKDVEVRQTYRVDLNSLRNLLKDAVETGKNAKPVIISLPTAEGKIEKFAVYSNPVMAQSLVEKYQLGSYVGAGIDDSSKYVRFSTSPTDMQSMIIKDGVFQFIEPISSDKKTYGVFYKTKKTGGEHGFECGMNEKDIKDIKTLEANGKKNLSNLGITSRPSSTKYRTYRLALSVTGEYTQFHGGTPAGALTAMNNTMSRVNGIFEKDFGIHLTVQDLPGIIYTNAATDPYSDSGPGVDNGLWSGELMTNLSSNVGSGLFDIGHLFGASGGGGAAGCIGCVCSNDTAVNSNGRPLNYKGSGFTSPANAIPQGDSFDIDYVAHEIGHQFGGNHTFSHNSEGSGANVEPGGGTTIMAYAGITSDNVQMVSNPYFHYKSIDQIMTNMEGKAGCGVAVDITNNTAPVISPLTAYTIPKGTAYYLDATAVDAEGDAVKYTWEQNNSVNNQATISGDSGWGYNTQGALARSYTGTASGRRYFPKMETVMNGSLTNKQDWETVSYIPRTLNYAVTVRDENAQRPMHSSAEIALTIGNDGPFKFNGLTAATILYNNASNTISWDPANTNAAPYNVSNVKIDYTADNGTTWTDLAASVPNTGSYAVQMPASLTGAVKLRISAVGNVFYSVSPAITVGAAPTSAGAPTGVSSIEKEIFKTTARISWNSVPGANTYSVNYRKQGETNWQNASSPTNSIVLTNLEDERNYEVKVAAVVNSVTGDFSTDYAFKTKGLLTGVDYCILNSGKSNYAAVRSIKVANVDYQDATYRSYKDLSTDLTKTINLTKGTAYTVETSILSSSTAYGGRSVNASVWIDYNRNGVFETSEKVGQVAGGLPDDADIISGLDIPFTVPATAYAGDKLLRMRIVVKNATGALADICGSIAGGGIMDLPVKITSALAVNEVKNTKSELSIYPNPADTYVEVKNIKGKADYKIYSADGRLVQEGKLEGQKINVAGLLKGMYVIALKDETTSYTTKLIKK
ncbi:propanediol utilization protein [Chryseobacterium pennae]|uniref:Propanediol utilization protein n=1 Tax=Chryseobacterium pennae TaxID=2258962 RepID=A0A3D9C0S4_9FLAO|nr:M12 family metallo-peptidase [Chryseobacterium pennae]REC59473.1 propanediol utilization protein [Chryseobacterium pennae]